MATRPKPAPCTMPTTRGRATVSPMIMGCSESRLECGGCVVLAGVAVGRQYVDGGTAEPRLGEVGDGIDAGVEALAGDRLDEALPGEVAAGRLELEGQQLVGAPERESDVVAVRVLLVEVGVHLVDGVQPGEGREEGGAVVE